MDGSPPTYTRLGRIAALEAALRSYVDACDNEECEYCIAAKAVLSK